MPSYLQRFLGNSLSNLRLRSSHPYISHNRDTLSNVMFETLENRSVLSGDPIDLQAIIEAYNTGRQQFQAADYAGLAHTVLGTNLPLVDKTLAEALGIGDLLADGTSNAPSLSVGSTLAQIESALTNAGFVKEYLSTSAEAATGDLMRFRFQTTIVDTTPLFDLGGDTGFEYFDSAVDGTFSGSLAATFQPMTLSITFGVDVQNDVVQFFLKEGELLDIQGVNLNGLIDANLAIRNLVDVDVEGPVTGSLIGSLSLIDEDTDDKIRIAQLADITALAGGTLDGNISLDPTLTAELPFVGNISWDGSWDATISGGQLNVGHPTFNAPSVASVTQAIQPAYNAIVGLVDILGGVNLDVKLPAIGKSLGEALGLPSFAGLGTGAGLSLNINENTILDLINGKPVDLIRFQISGGDSYSTSYTFPIAAAIVPIGPIPVSASLSLEAGVSASYSYYAGFGIDTTGFYIDAKTSISGAGGVFTGVNASVGLFGVLDVNVSAGVGASIGVGIGIHDPDGDGRLYLEEIIADLNQGQGSIGDEILARMDASLFGEAYGYARGVVEFLFWDWTIFDEHFTIAKFSDDLEDLNNPQDDGADYRTVYNRPSPIGTGLLEPELLQNGVLTLDMNTHDRGALANSVNLRSTEGGVEVTWRGVGTQIYAGVDTLVFVGNEESDQLTVSDGLAIHVVANGNGGADYLEAGALSSTLTGGDGSDSLFGGDSADTLLGGLGVDIIDGNGGNDSIEGGDKGDIISGGAGLDTILGQEGEDQIDGGSNDDYIVGGNDWDVIHGGSGNDVIFGDAGKDQLFGDGGDDVLYGGSQEDILVGGTGNDRLEGGSEKDLLYGDDGDPLSLVGGDDSLLGQEGDDYAFGEGGNDLIYGDDSLAGTDGGNDILSGDAGDDTLIGGTGQTNESGEGADVLYGGEGNDSLLGSRGDDQISGGTGTDTLDGQAGNDTLFLDFEGVGVTASDRVRGGVDQDMLAISGKAMLVQTDPDDPESFYLNDIIDDVIELRQLDANNFQALRYDTVGGIITDTMSFYLDGTTGGDIERLGIYGRGGNDTIYASSDPNYTVQKNLAIDGGLGDDSLTGGEGRDSIIGGIGADSIRGGAGDDVLHGDEDRDTVEGGSGHDIIYGGDEIGLGDSIIGGADRDVVYAGDGDDWVSAGEGNLGDIIYGGNGNDTLVGGDGMDVLRGNDGNDSLVGGALGDVLLGGQDDDTLEGDSGRDRMFGDEGNDVIYANTPELEADSPDETNWQLTIQQLGERSDELLGDLSEGQVGLITLVGHERSAANIPLQATISEIATTQSQLNVLLAKPPQSRTPDEDARIVSLGAQLAALNARRVEYQRIYDLIDVEYVRLQNEAAVVLTSMINLLPNETVDIDLADGGDGDDSLFGSAYPDELVGGEGNDTIFHSAGDDVISGGEDPDNSDNDVYTFLATEQDDVIDVTLTDAGGDNLAATVINNGVTIGGLMQIDIETVGVNGLGGDDTLSIHFGNQATVLIMLDGGNGNDLLTADLAQARATLLGGAGNDTLIGGLSDDSLDGGADDDSLLGGDGNDTLNGNSQNDTLVGGLGNDSLEGGFGDDWVTEHFDDPTAGWRLTITDTSMIGGRADSSGHVAESFGTDSLIGDIERILGTNAPDKIDGISLTHNILQFGMDGYDTLIGGSGADYLSGGAGDDVIHGGLGNDTIVGGMGHDHIDEYTYFSAPGAANYINYIFGDLGPNPGENVVFTEAGLDAFLHVGGGDGLLRGDIGRDYIVAGGGDDGLVLGGQGSGDDIIFGGDGNDSIRGHGGDGAHTFDGHDYLNGGNGNDEFIAPGLGNDTIVGGMGSDHIDEYTYFVGPDAANYINYIFGDLGPNPGENVVFTEAGLDAFLHVGSSDALLRGDIGRDYIVAGGGDDGNVLGGQGSGDDIIFGGDGNDSIRGHGGDGAHTFDGNDYLNGGDGNDEFIAPGLGNDTIVGGMGSDHIDEYTYFVGPGAANYINYIFGDLGPNPGENVVFTEAGLDAFLHAGGGDALLRGDIGRDYIVAGGGNDGNVLGGYGSGDDIIFGGDGNDSIRGHGGDNPYTMDGHDYMSGGNGNDEFVQPGLGNDTIIGGPGNDYANEYTYSNEAYSYHNYISGGPGDDRTIGDNGYDEIYGGSGNDELRGGFSNVVDLIDPGTGCDQIHYYFYDPPLYICNNTPPVVVTASNVNVTEGQDWIFSAAGSFDPDGDPLVNFSVEISLNGNLRSFDSSTPTIIVPWAMISDVVDGGQSYSATVRVQDENYEYQGTGSQAIIINVANANPAAAAISALSSAVRGEPVKFTLTATDPSSVDQAAGFTFNIDWNGDGSVDEVVQGLSGTEVTHVFANQGSYNVRVTATDKDGGVSEVAEYSIEIVSWQTRVDANDPSKTNLIWGGTNGVDAYAFVPGLVLKLAENNQFFAFQTPTGQLLGTPQLAFLPTYNGKMIVYAQGGNDLLFADIINGPLEFYGGDGDDVLIGGRGSDTIDGGNGNDIIFGGTLSTDGDDLLLGGAGDDLVIGHFGADTIDGGSGSDLLVAGSLYFPANLPASIYAIHAEWLAPRPIAQRVANLSGTGTPPRNNGQTFLQSGSTVMDDQSIDHVFGDTDADWLLLDVETDITLPDPEDLLTDL